MNTACVIGNGPSRLQFDLHCINAIMKTYGCNALYRDFMPNNLIAVDYEMVDEIVTNNIHKKCKFYTNQENYIKTMSNIDSINLLSSNESFDSGNTALNIALKDGYEKVYIIGFDYGLNSTTIPNVYAGSKNYNTKLMYPAASIRYSEWKQRFNIIKKRYKNQQIIRVVLKDPISSIDNYSEITIEQFKKVLINE